MALLAEDCDTLFSPCGAWWVAAALRLHGMVAGSTAGLGSHDLYACRLWGDGLSPGRGVKTGLGRGFPLEMLSVVIP